MILSDKMAYRQIIGSLMINPLLFIQYQDIYPTDFIECKIARICFINIQKLYNEGATKLTPIEVDQEVEKHPNSALVYNAEGGLDFLKASYEFAEISNFNLYYTRLKKYSLLNRLLKNGYDVSDFYIDNNKTDDPLLQIQIQQHFDESSIEDILNSVEGKYNIIRNEYLQGGRSQDDPSQGIEELIEELQQAPNIGPSLEGKIFSSACRGAREGCFYLKSSSSGSGKSRTSIFDACHIAYPIRYSHEKGTFIIEKDNNDQPRQPRKVLFIVTEMDVEELQTIMLAYLSGVDEGHILTGKYELGELSRVKFAAKIMQFYKGYLLIEEISDPNLVNVESTIKKYATIDNVKYVFFDYIHSTASMIGQFAKNNLREDTILMMMANQLKQLAKDYSLFIFSATQVNMSAMADDGEFKNEMSIRASKAIADKCDVGYVMTKINQKNLNSYLTEWRKAARMGYLEPKYIDDENYRPTHVLDIYKNRRGRYKNVRIWTRLHLGTGERQDLFMTTAENEPLQEPLDLFSSAREEIIDWRNYFDN